MAVQRSPSLSSSCACVGAGRSQLKREGKREQKRALSAYLSARKLTSLKKVRTRRVFRCCNGKAIVENYNNFRKSGIPDRIMYFQKGEWKDFSLETVALLKQAFRNRTSGVEVVMGGLSYIVDFLRMSQIDLRNGGRTSIAWIDVNGKCFFPRVVCEEDGEGNEEHSSSSPSLDVKIDLRIDARRLGSNVGREESCVESQNSSDKGNVQSSDKENVQSIDKGNGQSGVSDDQNSECCTGRVRPSANSECCTGRVRSSANESCFELFDNLIRLTEDDLECVAVQRRFYGGLGALRLFTRVVGVYRNLHTNVSGQSRLHAFKRHEIMRKTQGNANIRYAWHGTSKSGVSGIILHGFGHPMIPKHGAAYGKGVYLAPQECAYLSAAYSDVDENGEQHMVLCRVILGNSEQVMLGSQQYHPSSEQFDTGVDDLKNPRQYIVWSTHMNTHILPEYVVSFKVPPQLHEYWSSLKAKRGAGQGIPRQPLQDGQFACPRSISKMDGDERSSPGLVKESLESSPGLVKESHEPSPGLVKESHEPSRAVVKKSQHLPTSAWMSFPKLFSVIQKFLSPKSISLLNKHYADYKDCKISREVLIRRLRMIAGDKLLTSVIKMFQGHVLPSMKEKMGSVPEN